MTPKEQFIEAASKKLQRFRTQPFKSSLEWFIDKGTISGSFLLAIGELYEETQNLNEETRKDSVKNCELSIEPMNCGSRLNNDCRGCSYYNE